MGNLFIMNKRQKLHLERHLKNNSHKDYNIDLKLSDTKTLLNYSVFKNVLRPETTSSIFFAKWLNSNSYLYLDKYVLDMGCGNGLQGIVAGLNGAKKVVFSDISEFAVKNTLKNIKQYRLLTKSKVVNSNLFENINNKFDVIIFNHPFLPGSPIKNKIISYAILGGTKLFTQFLIDAKKHLTKNGKIITIYFKLAGNKNDPEIQGLKNGYNVKILFKDRVDIGLQKGTVIVCLLSL